MKKWPVQRAETRSKGARVSEIKVRDTKGDLDLDDETSQEEGDCQNGKSSRQMLDL